MSRTEGSVSVSIQQLLAQEKERRAEQVYLAHRLMKEQERLAMEEVAARAEAAQKRAEAAARELRQRSLSEAAEQQRLDTERQLVLERTRVDLELQSKTTLLRLQQQQELERLAIVRDVRVRLLEGHRAFLLAGLTTMLVGGCLIYGFALRPAAQRQTAALQELARLNDDQRASQKVERDTLDRRLEEQSRVIASKERERSQLLEQITKLRNNGSAAKSVIDKSTRPPLQVAKKCTCDKSDPLCDCWSGD